MATPPSPVKPNLLYVDHSEVGEIFADAVERMTFDGGVLRMEFVVHRLDELRPPEPQTGSKHTACRLVLPIAALPNFANQMTILMNVLVQQGVLQRHTTPAAPETSKA